MERDLKILKGQAVSAFMIKEKFSQDIIGKRFVVSDVPEVLFDIVKRLEVRVGIYNKGNIAINDISEFGKFDLEKQVVATKLWVVYGDEKSVEYDRFIHMGDNADTIQPGRR